MGSTRFASGLSKAIVTGLLLLPSGSCLPAAGAEVVPTVQELIAGFRQNYAVFASPHIQWCCASTRGKAWYQSMERNSKYLAEIATAKTITEKEAAELLRESRALKRISQIAESDVICFDYWTDRLTCQVRFWDSSKPGRDGQGEFPSAPLTPRNLETVYQDINIASYLPGTTPACRIWGGISAGGMKTGATHDHAIPQSMGSFLYPPLGVSDRQWGYGAWSEIDKFFGFPPGEMRVVQKETMEGAACWLVRHVSLQPAGEDLAKHGKFQIGMVTRAWIDPRRGCLPVRMDWYSEVYRDGALFRERKPEPYSVLKVNAIKKIDRGGFYPTEGVTESHVPDPSQPFEPLTGAEFVAGKTLDLQYVMDQSTRWFVKSIEPDAKLPRESLAFEFPDGTNYFDSLRGRTLVKGISEEEYDRLIAGGDDVGGEPPSGSPYRLYLIIAGNIILFAALIAFWRKRRRS